MFESFALHRINNEQELPFSATDYSRFKFGDMQQAEKFGAQLGRAFVQQYAHLLIGDIPIVILPSPYDSIPTASNAMAGFFRKYINYELYKNGRNCLLQSKIHRYKTYSEDYGNLNHDQRLELISSDTYHIDKDFLQNRVILVLDDIKITGSHEHVIKKKIDEHRINGHFIFVYFAELTNKNIPANFENYLNYYYVKGLDNLKEIIQSDTFKFNTRVIKYILKSAPADFERFVDDLAPGQIRLLIELALSNNYHCMPAYETNLSYLIKCNNYGN